MDWHTVQRIDHQRLKREYKDPDRSSLRRLILDEFALFKGHQYATVAQLTETKLEQVMDMNSAFDPEAKAHYS